MEVVTLPLPPSVRSKLLAAGHHSTAGLLYTTPSQLVRGKSQGSLLYFLCVYVSVFISILDCNFFFG